MAPRFPSSIFHFPLKSHLNPTEVAKKSPKHHSKTYLAITPRLTFQQSRYRVQTTTETGTQTLTPTRQDDPGLELALRGGIRLASWLSTGVEVGLNRFSSRYTTQLTDLSLPDALSTSQAPDGSYTITASPQALAAPIEQRQTDVRAQLNTQVFIDVHPRHGRYGLESGVGFSSGLYQGVTTTVAGASNTVRQPSGQIQPIGQALAYLRLWQHGATRLRLEAGLRIAPDRYQTTTDGVSIYRRQALVGIQLQF